MDDLKQRWTTDVRSRHCGDMNTVRFSCFCERGSRPQKAFLTLRTYRRYDSLNDTQAGWISLRRAASELRAQSNDCAAKSNHRTSDPGSSMLINENTALHEPILLFTFSFHSDLRPIFVLPKRELGNTGRMSLFSDNPNVSNEMFR
jgi:hypothetical protein